MTFCLWEEYQRTGLFSDMTRWLKHRAYCGLVLAGLEDDSDNFWRPECQ
ncbi:hypothetical protein M0R72_19725 [Candidatus Pacearchaeota archaeon]|nr:hypothetical protein [Candidatus Pacearchaeota archaeon]